MHRLKPLGFDSRVSHGVKQIHGTFCRINRDKPSTDLECSASGPEYIDNCSGYFMSCQSPFRFGIHLSAPGLAIGRVADHPVKRTWKGFRDRLPEVVPDYRDPVLETIFPDVSHGQPVQLGLDFHAIDPDVGTSVDKDQGYYPTTGSQVQYRFAGPRSNVMG